MRILTVLTYYRPHTSGLTIYAERLARALSNRGHSVTVLTSQYMPELPREEVKHGVRIVRIPVILRVSKGVIMPSFGYVATRLAFANDVLHIHLPQLDAPFLALGGRILKKPTVLTYHCDLTLPPGPFSGLLNQGVTLAHHLAAMLAHRIVTYTQDYADNSPYLSRYKRKLRIIQPPVELPPAPDGSVEAFRRLHNLDSQRPVIGMAARLATEKGVEVLLNAMPEILEYYPKAKVLFAGQYEDVLGEGDYYNRLIPSVLKYQEQGHWKFLGVLNPNEMSTFYLNLDVLVVPSLNSTEAFGLVQIEAMMNGTPCIASSLPGVRQPILTTGMGKVVPIGDSRALAKAVLSIMEDPQRYQRNREAIVQHFSPDTAAAEYEGLFRELMPVEGQN
jgi:glycosyltransferase involved in cell wall biosynthesis